jgi:hypothetical protein
MMIGTHNSKPLKRFSTNKRWLRKRCLALATWRREREREREKDRERKKGRKREGEREGEREREREKGRERKKGRKREGEREGGREGERFSHQVALRPHVRDPRRMQRIQRLPGYLLSARLAGCERVS